MRLARCCPCFLRRQCGCSGWRPTSPSCARAGAGRGGQSRLTLSTRGRSGAPLPGFEAAQGALDRCWPGGVLEAEGVPKVGPREPLDQCNPVRAACSPSGHPTSGRPRRCGCGRGVQQGRGRTTPAGRAGRVRFRSSTRMRQISGVRGSSGGRFSLRESRWADCRSAVSTWS